jgi:GNAT superfamily N-acetyltransferase
MPSWSDSIRVASPSDADSLARLCEQLGYPSTAAQVRERLRLLDDPERTLLVAGAAGGVAGFIDVHVQRTVEEDPFGEVGGLVVAEEYRGSGLGAALIEAATAWSRERGVARLWIRANLARGDAAHGFYAHLGCRAVKDQRVYELPL